MAIAAVDGGEKRAGTEAPPLLLIGDEARSRDVIRTLFAALAAEERLRLTFSTHFYESDHLRSLFRLVTVRSRAEAPSQRGNYIVFDLDEGVYPQMSPASAYADWLADCLRAGRWEEIRAVNAVLNELRRPQERSQGARLPFTTHHSPLTILALWERAGVKVAQVLIGEARLVVEFLRHCPSPRPLADALLATASPSELCGAEAASDVVEACLSALRSTATRKVWRAWVKQWETDPLLGSFAQDAQPWWRRWRRGKGERQ